MATTAFNTVKNLYRLGRNLKTAWGKWANGISVYPIPKDNRCKKKPIVKKLVWFWQCRRRSVSTLIHEKKIMEMEKELQTLLNFRFGYGTWDELKEMQRKIRADREKQFC